ncbi:hypothetical protein K437DRAFT_68063 [Tilletiaria anomala UBC 951]|uniref:Uncharacterized protein n=1 Tax=Tilletiaria anomala (strain ATCC 24038 / CBS 436.72 / UBC 951) TaxID=1037660 RepID=A0A066V253_TILAU|nr:uncharacterized protein K437DRAFT_68063 [Tilletiaria anomala UBC 951]KDN35782.1 hypothetical protein K437DRAFT_68063 [Tilletiaria anomala UBC 951]
MNKLAVHISKDPSSLSATSLLFLRFILNPPLLLLPGLVKIIPQPGNCTTSTRPRPPSISELSGPVHQPPCSPPCWHWPFLVLTAVKPVHLEQRDSSTMFGHFVQGGTNCTTKSGFMDLLSNSERTADLLGTGRFYHIAVGASMAGSAIATRLSEYPLLCARRIEVGTNYASLMRPINYGLVSTPGYDTVGCGCAQVDLFNNGVNWGFQPCRSLLRTTVFPVCLRQNAQRFKCAQFYGVSAPDVRRPGYLGEADGRVATDF